MEVPSSYLCSYGFSYTFDCGHTQLYLHDCAHSSLRPGVASMQPRFDIICRGLSNFLEEFKSDHAGEILLLVERRPHVQAEGLAKVVPV